MAGLKTCHMFSAEKNAGKYVGKKVKRSMLISYTLLKHTILWLILFELVSLVSYTFPIVNTIIFFVILGATLVISLRKLEWGLCIVLAELFVGSFGRLFSFETGGFEISLRIGIFIVIMAVWVVQEIKKTSFDKLQGTQKQKNNNTRSYGTLRGFVATKIGKWYVAFGFVLLWSLVLGLIRNDFSNVFFDFNNWLYILYTLPFYSVFISLKNYKLDNFFTILTASLVVVSIKTIVLLWFFAHQVPGTIEMLYRWVRDFGIGEITFYANNFYRVFMQSQIWLLLGFFIFLGILTVRIADKGSPFSFLLSPFKEKQKRQPKVVYPHSILIILCLTSLSLIISFSRSLWLAWVMVFGIFFLLLLTKFKWPFKRVLAWAASFIGILIIELLLIVAIINIPPVQLGGDFGSLVSNRLTRIEAAGSSRINLLSPLWEEIKKHPVLGSGFGTTVTYRSVDPRILTSTAGASGEYTTYAFEWAYLDMWLKFGLVGLVVYFGLLWRLGTLCWKRTIVLLKAQKERDYLVEQGITFGFFLALIALIIVNLTTPYLNHPLGIGFVILVTVKVLMLEKEATINQ